MEEVWDRLTSDLNEKRHEWWKRIAEKYTAEDRIYHDLKHTQNKYLLYESVRSLIKNSKAFELALFFNYLEYDPKSMENYEKNVEKFKAFSDDCGIDSGSELHVGVVELLKCSGTHITEEHKTKDAYGTEDRHYFLDLDVAVLGSEPEKYSEYADKVKQEYHFLPPPLYNSLRLKVLQNFLQIPNIFATQVFRDRFEKQARLNIQKEINTLQQFNT